MVKLSELRPELKKYIEYKTISSSTYTLLKTDHNTILIIDVPEITISFPINLGISFHVIVQCISNNTIVNIEKNNFFLLPITEQYSDYSFYFFQIVLNTIIVSNSIDHNTIIEGVSEYLNTNYNNTDQLPEGSTNLYYTNTRVSEYIANNLNSTDDLAEGESNLYFDNDRANALISPLITEAETKLNTLILNTTAIADYLNLANSTINDFNSFVRASSLVPIIRIDNPIFVIYSIVNINNITFTIKDNYDNTLFTKQALAYTDVVGQNNLYYFNFEDKLKNNTLTSGNIYKLYKDLIFHYYFIVQYDITIRTLEVTINSIENDINNTNNWYILGTVNYLEADLTISIGDTGYSFTTTPAISIGTNLIGDNYTFWSLTVSKLVHPAGQTVTVLASVFQQEDTASLLINAIAPTMSITGSDLNIISGNNLVVTGTFSSSETITGITLLLDNITYSASVTGNNFTVDTGLTSLAVGNYTGTLTLAVSGFTTTDTIEVVVSASSLAISILYTGTNSSSGTFASDTTPVITVKIDNLPEVIASLDYPSSGLWEAVYLGTTFDPGTHTCLATITQGTLVLTDTATFTVEGTPPPPELLTTFEITGVTETPNPPSASYFVFTGSINVTTGTVITFEWETNKLGGASPDIYNATNNGNGTWTSEQIPRTGYSPDIGVRAVCVYNSQTYYTANRSVNTMSDPVFN